MHRKKVKKNLGLKFEGNLSVNTERSGTDYCWLYCGTLVLDFRHSTVLVFDEKKILLKHNNVLSWVLVELWDKSLGYVCHPSWIDHVTH